MDSSPSTGPSPFPPILRGEIEPGEHIAQFYAHDALLVDTLVRFVDRGLMAGEGVVVIATREHLRALEKRLSGFMFGMAAYRFEGAYIAVDAGVALGKFMVKDWPDDELFLDFIMGLVSRASADGRRVRAFGEMVALLWAEGNTAATLRLEDLWKTVCKLKNLPLLCAYPKQGIAKHSSSLMTQICAAHSRII
jgi:MEDS: MEthanogen/methylotroph, DcmR Sensory domain